MSVAPNPFYYSLDGFTDVQMPAIPEFGPFEKLVAVHWGGYGQSPRVPNRHFPQFGDQHGGFRIRIKPQPGDYGESGSSGGSGPPPKPTPTGPPKPGPSCWHASYFYCEAHIGCGPHGPEIQGCEYLATYLHGTVVGYITQPAWYCIAGWAAIYVVIAIWTWGCGGASSGSPPTGQAAMQPYADTPAAIKARFPTEAAYIASMRFP